MRKLYLTFEIAGTDMSKPLELNFDKTQYYQLKDVFVVFSVNIELVDVYIEKGILREEIPDIWNDKDVKEFAKFYTNNNYDYNFALEAYKEKRIKEC